MFMERIVPSILGLLIGAVAFGVVALLSTGLGASDTVANIAGVAVFIVVSGFAINALRRSFKKGGK